MTGKKQIHGQVLTEYAVMLVLLTVIAAALLGFGYVFSRYGGHLVDMVSIEYP